jgi:hypothetical protein
MSRGETVDLQKISKRCFEGRAVVETRFGLMSTSENEERLSVTSCSSPLPPPAAIIFHGS